MNQKKLIENIRGQERVKMDRRQFETRNENIEEFFKRVTDNSHSSGGFSMSTVTTTTAKFLHSTQNDSFHLNSSKFYKRPQNGPSSTNFSNEFSLKKV